jgi:hypothetical protein
MFAAAMPGNGVEGSRDLDQRLRGKRSQSVSIQKRQELSESALGARERIGQQISEEHDRGESGKASGAHR